MAKKINVAVVGASGYSGEELLRLLFRHPHCELRTVTSRQHAGTPVAGVFTRFTDRGLAFVAPDVERIAQEAEVAFLALPHGLAAEFARPLLKAGVTVIDISADFRLRDTAVYRTYYKDEHPAPELLPEAVYGLPERYREPLRTARLIACAGCYPTSIILAAAPLLAAGIVRSDGILVASMSGVTGAGRKVDLPYLFPECNESVRAYSPTGHRHLPEIEQELAVAAGVPAVAINFVPHLVPVNRGINSTLFLQPAPGVDAAKIAETYAQAYADEPFVRVLPQGRLADTKNVTLTNVCEIGFALDAHTGRLIVTSAIDNLTKGASGQAIQCCNLRHGFPEVAGLE
jgi:N-acetyl-gamma-glutamyl-phosphate reductase